VVFIILRGLYNAWFHPLAKYPGPFLWGASRLPYGINHVRGRLAYRVLDLHKKYGSIVRIAPDELAFLDPQAWKDIYGHRVGTLHGQPELPKDPRFYRVRDAPPNILSEDREPHSQLRKQMAHAFSDKAMREQEPLIERYISQLIKGLREHCVDKYTDDEKSAPRPVPLDIKTWYNWTTFDVMGDLAFGEPFDCLEKAEYNPWVAAIAHGVRQGPIFGLIRILGMEPVVRPILKQFLRARKTHLGSTTEMLKRRIARGAADRPDIIAPLLDTEKMVRGDASLTQYLAPLAH
jgi:cytochrome P450